MVVFIIMINFILSTAERSFMFVLLNVFWEKTVAKYLDLVTLTSKVCKPLSAIELN